MHRKAGYAYLLLSLFCYGCISMPAEKNVFTASVPLTSSGPPLHYYLARMNDYELKKKNLSPGSLKVLQYAEEDLRKNVKRPIKFIYFALGNASPNWGVIIEYTDDESSSTVVELIVSDNGNYIRYLGRL